MTTFATEEMLVYPTDPGVGYMEAFTMWDLDSLQSSTSADEINVNAGTVFLIICLSLIIIGTIFGNVLTLTAIHQHRPLQTPQNYLIASLAVADLMVAIVVMPLSLSKEVVVKWIFGPILCDFWISMDVLCCTASILSLCMISLDRFWAITKPVLYPKYRTLRTMLMMIATVWILATVISVSPLLGWRGKQDMDPSMCRISQHKIYTIFSTFGAFFIPMTIMMIVYGRIFCEARRRIRGRSFKSPLGPGHPEITTANDRYSEFNALQSKHIVNGDGSLETRNISTLEMQKKLSSNGKTKSVPDMHHKSTDSKDTTNSKVKSSMVTSLSVPGQKGDGLNSLSLTEINDNMSQTKVLLTPKPAPSPLPSQLQERERKRRALAVAREQRATKTLGIVTGAFLACWLPFFLQALILPLCSESCHLPLVWHSIFLWLGYFNSMLNPIIYTKFNQDFQKAFKKLLHCKGASKNRPT